MPPFTGTRDPIPAGSVALSDLAFDPATQQELIDAIAAINDLPADWSATSDDTVTAGGSSLKMGDADAALILQADVGQTQPLLLMPMIADVALPALRVASPADDDWISVYASDETATNPGDHAASIYLSNTAYDTYVGLDVVDRLAGGKVARVTVQGASGFVKAESDEQGSLVEVRAMTGQTAPLLAIKDDGGTTITEVVPTSDGPDLYVWSGDHTKFVDVYAYDGDGAYLTVYDNDPGSHITLEAFNGIARLELSGTYDPTDIAFGVESIAGAARFSVYGDGSFGVQKQNTGSSFRSGSGAPNNADGANGDYYFRSDGGVATHVYFKSGGTWAGVI